MVSVQVARPERRAVVLIIRRSWVRAPPAPPDPLTGREIRFRKTYKTERTAQIELDKLLAMGQANRPLMSLVHASRSLVRVVATTARCPAAARTSASPWRRAPSVASTASCPGPSRQRCGGSGPTGTRPPRPDPVPEVDRRAAAYLAQLIAGSATQSV